MNIARLLIRLLPSKPVFAHCDIPCGIYDPHTSQMAAQTVLKMVQKINELPLEKDPTLENRNNFKRTWSSQASLIRMVMIKEEHAELCKKEILILWTDYFKDEHLQKFPDLHSLIWKTTKLCSDNKRMVDEIKAQELIEAVNTIADIFEQTKK